MGTTAKKPPSKPKDNLPANTQQGALPAFMQEAAAADAGKGTSQSAEDNIVPLVRILQSNSPQVDKHDVGYVPGAEAGMIWLRGSGLPAINGEDGLLFQPCFFEKVWNEWIPRDDGGGFLGAHAERPQDAREVPDPKDPKRKLWMSANGTEYKETRNHIGYIIFPDGHAQGYVIPFSSSGHTTSRNWMAMMNAKKVGENAAPSWAAKYRLRTKQRKNKKGTWFVFEVADEGWVTSMEDYQRGRKLYDDFSAGLLKAEAEHADDEGEEETEHSAM